MSKKSRKKAQRKKQRRVSKPQTTGASSAKFLWLAGAVVVALALAGIGFWWLNRPQQEAEAIIAATVEPNQPDAAATAAVTPTLPPNVGPVNQCLHRPAFISQLDLGDQIYIGTNLKGYKGLTLSAQQPDGQVKIYQHPTWDDAGNLAAYALDRDGNIYVGPAPFVSLDENAPEAQNNLYKVDTNSGEMTLFMQLPWAAPPNTSNPYGIMGLTYDCDAHDLYVSSLAGSSYDAEVGRIFQIDLDSESIVSQLDGVDAFGLGVYRGVEGKRLYFGSARNSSIRSVALAENGALGTEQRLEFYLLAAPGGQDERAKKIQFPQQDAMLVKGIEFNYTLRAASDFLEHDYTYRYDPAADAWEFEETHRREGVF